MKTTPYLPSWLLFSVLLVKATVSDARRQNDKSGDMIPSCSPHTGRINCKVKIVGCGRYFLEPDAKVAITSRRLIRRNTCEWNFKTLEDYDLRVACRTTLQGPPICRTSHLAISDGSNRRIKLCSSTASAGMTSKTGELVIGSKVSRRKAAGRLKYECTVAAVKSTHTAMFTVPPPSDPVLPVSRCRCGRANRASRIVGGNLVKPHEYPWQVALFRNNETAPYCGGSIISDTWVLTAAHCLVSVRPENLEVVIGEHDWSTSDETSITRRIKPKFIVWHEGFSFRKPVQHDIGLVELDEPLYFPEDNSVAPVCLPRPHLSHPRTNAMVVGWGATEDFGGRSKILRFANVKTMTNEACQVLVGLTGGVTPNMICAGHLFSGETACYGDSGGPLLAEGEGCGGKCLTIIGIVSWGAFCKIGALPTVYTRTNRYLGWINMFIKRSNTCQV